MRTLKKALSLVLVLAMVFALAVPGFAADTTKKAADFKDYSKVTNKEAVDVLTAIGVINGNADGTFAPEGNFTRAEAATMITYLTLGKTVADALPTSATKFSDVPATHWAAKYVQYCADAGIVAGVGNGKFDPDAKLTATQWSLMLLGALGYNAKNEGIGGEGWEIATTKLAMKAGVATAEELTGTFNRDMAAKLALNALKATTVEYASNGTNITIGDTVISTGASKATAVEVANTNTYAKAISTTAGAAKDTVTVELGEKLYNGKLVLAATTSEDDFGRDVKVWEYNKKDVATTTATPTFTFTAATSDKEIAKTLKGYTFGATKLADVDTEIGADTTIGALKLTATSKDKIADKLAKLTGNGTVVEVYADAEKKVENVVVIAYHFNKVSDIKTDAKGKTTVTIGSTPYYMNDGDNKDTIVLNGDVKKGDFVTYVVAKSTCYVYPTTNFEGKMTKFNTTAQTMTVNGTTYQTGAATVDSKVMETASSFNGTATSKFYVDQFGYIVAVDGINDIKYAVIDSIAYVTGTGVEGVGYAEAKLVFTDGKTEIVKVASIDKKTPVTKITDSDKEVLVNADAKSNTSLTGSIYTYSVDANGKYVLKADTTVTAGTASFTKGLPAIGTLGGIANNNTTYVVKTKSGDKAVWNVYTGYKAMPSAAGVTADYVSTTADGIVFVYVDATKASSMGDTTSDVVFVLSTAYTTDKSDSTKDLYEYTAILNGELKTVVATDKDLFATANTLYKVTLNEKGQVTKAEKAADAYFYTVYANGTAKGGVLGISKDAAGTDATAINSKVSDATYVTYGDNTVVYFVHTDSKTVTTGSLESVADNAQIYVKTVEQADTANGYAVATAYVVVAD